MLGLMKIAFIFATYRFGRNLKTKQNENQDNTIVF